jgi:6-phosphofructokinase 2
MGPSIITLTLNPALDFVASTGDICHTHKVRMDEGKVAAGGGGINVSHVVRELGCATVAIFLCGGAIGYLIGRLLKRDGIPHSPVGIAGENRLCVTAKEANTGHEYRLVPSGPTVSAGELARTLARLDAADGDWVVASGSLPPGIPEDTYASVARRVHARGQRFALDTSGPALLAAVKSGCAPDLLKLSLRELKEVAGRDLPQSWEQENEALALANGGKAGIVAVTLGAEGAFVAAGGVIHRMQAMAVPALSTVGAGDSFLAGMVVTLARRQSIQDALGWGVATGVGGVAAAGAAHVRRDGIHAYRQRLFALAA